MLNIDHPEIISKVPPMKVPKVYPRYETEALSDIMLPRKFGSCSKIRVFVAEY